ncbi:MAG TPA: HAD-IA family hydrolase [Verrucomicrobiales bacterium]|nr:HAD-IA family hydrolase [Verrucomicrobiales bacterium]
MTPELDGVFFDAAGTLISVREPVGTTYARFAGRHGMGLDPAAAERAFRALFARAETPAYGAPGAGHGSGEAVDRAWWSRLVWRVFRQAGVAGLEEERFENCFRDVFRHYGTGAAWKLYPEVRGVLDALRGRVRLAVVSNFDARLEGVLVDLGIGAVFDAVVVSSAVEACKPDPALFREALRRCRIADPARAMHAGDSPHEDWEGAAAAGLRVFRLTRGANDLSGILGCLSVKT